MFKHLDIKITFLNIRSLTADVWLAQLVEGVALDFGVVSLSPVTGVEFKYIK